MSWASRRSPEPGAAAGSHRVARRQAAAAGLEHALAFAGNDREEPARALPAAPHVQCLLGTAGLRAAANAPSTTRRQPGDAVSTRPSPRPTTFTSGRRRPSSAIDPATSSSRVLWWSWGLDSQVRATASPRCPANDDPSTCRYARSRRAPRRRRRASQRVLPAYARCHGTLATREVRYQRSSRVVAAGHVHRSARDRDRSRRSATSDARCAFQGRSTSAATHTRCPSRPS